MAVTDEDEQVTTQDRQETERTFLTQLFHDLGIEMPPDDFARFVVDFEETLHKRVGETIHECLNDDQRQELIQLQNADPERVQVWLLTAIPDLDSLVQDERDILVGEVVHDLEQTGLV